MLLALVFALVLAARGQECSGVCGLVGHPCCNCVFEPNDPRCAVSLGSRWCVEGSCAGKLCERMTISDQSPQPCGVSGQACCPRGWCSGLLTCASGTCVSLAGVSDQSACGLDGATCCGALSDCDGDLLCDGGTCKYTGTTKK